MVNNGKFNVLIARENHWRNKAARIAVNARAVDEKLTLDILVEPSREGSHLEIRRGQSSVKMAFLRVSPSTSALPPFATRCERGGPFDPSSDLTVPN